MWILLERTEVPFLSSQALTFFSSSFFIECFTAQKERKVENKKCFFNMFKVLKINPLLTLSAYRKVPLLFNLQIFLTNHLQKIGRKSNGKIRFEFLRAYHHHHHPTNELQMKFMVNLFLFFHLLRIFLSTRTHSMKAHSTCTHT